MSTIKKIDQRARKLCTQTVVYTDLTDAMVLVRALAGRTTKAIAREFKLTESEAQYRITKAQKDAGTYFRADYRNGTSTIAQEMLHATEAIGLSHVRKTIVPRFAPYAAPGVPRTLR